MSSQTTLQASAQFIKLLQLDELVTCLQMGKIIHPVVKYS